jgi:hypothetical protein
LTGLLILSIDAGARFSKSICLAIRHRRQSHIIDGMRWYWRCMCGEIVDLENWCVRDGTKLESSERRVEVTWEGSQIYEVTYRCDSCGEVHGPFAGGDYAHKQAVKRQIARGYANADWVRIESTNTLKQPR